MASAIADDLIQHPRHDLEVTISAPGGHVELLVSGEVDLRSVPTLQACLDEVASSGTGPVVVDLRDVTFLDSTGLAILVAAHNRLTAASRALTVRDPRRSVRRVLEISGVDALLDLHFTAVPLEGIAS